MRKKLSLLLIATSMSAMSAQTQTLSVQLGNVGTPNEHTIHLEATSTGTVLTKGFQFRQKGATAWTTTGYTNPFSADISNLTNGKWEYRAFVRGTSRDTLFSETKIIQLLLCCEATATITYPPIVPLAPEVLCTISGGVLINGVCWATRNVDMPNTFVANPEDYGMFYQYNRKVGWSSSDPLTSSDGSRWDASMPSGNEQGKRIIKKSLTFVSKKSWSPSIILPNYRIHV